MFRFVKHETFIKARQYSEEQSREILSQAAVLSEQATEIELQHRLNEAHEESETLLFNILPAPIAPPSQIRRNAPLPTDSIPLPSFLSILSASRNFPLALRRKNSCKA